MTPPDAQLAEAAVVLRALGAGLAALGAGAALLEGTVGADAAVRASWAARWRAFAPLDWWRAAAAPVVAVAAGVDDVIRRVFLQADRRGELGTAALLVILIVIPVAAAVNAVTGGSPFLITYYGVLLAAIAVLFVSGEIPALAWLNGVISVAVLASLFGVIPLYLLHSFTDFSRNEQSSQILVHALFVIPFWGVAALFLSLALDQVAFRLGERTAGDVVRLRHRVLAFLPLALVALHLLFIAGQQISGAPLEGRSWALIVPVTGLTAATAGLSLWLVALAHRCERPETAVQAVGLAALLGVAAGLGSLRLAGVADGWGAAGRIMLGHAADGTVDLNWPFWVSHAPALMAYALAALLAVGVVGKGVALGLDAARRPYLASGVVIGLFGAAAWLCGVWLAGGA